MADRRKLEGAALDRVTDGRAFTGRQAVELGLVDELGDEETALAWLREKHGIDRHVGVVERSWDGRELPWPFSAVSEGAMALDQLQRLVAAGPRLYALIRVGSCRGSLTAPEGRETVTSQCATKNQIAAGRGGTG